MVHVHAIKLPIHFVIEIPPSVCSVFSGVILVLIDTPRLKVFHAVKKSCLVPFFCHWNYVAYWLVSGHDWLWVIIYFIQLVYIHVVDSITSLSSGSALVHYFAAALYFLFSVDFWISHPNSISVPFPCLSLVNSMKRSGVELGPDKRVLNFDKISPHEIHLC